MKGYKVWFGKDKGNCMYHLTKTKKEAWTWVKGMDTVLKISAKQGIEEVEVKECRCGRLYQPAVGCLTCEKIMYDVQCDKSLYENDNGKNPEELEEELRDGAFELAHEE